MTVTAIHPPSKLLDLDAVVRSTAVCVSAGLVGALTAGPAKLALFPIAGGSGPVVDLAIESPQELALLSRDVAVVRANDGALWAIGDLGGSPRARLVARDVRALVMRPQGESALALNQDGSAGAITLSKQEVSVRAFAVRGGALRACSIGENVSFAVADGEGGGQLRIHPGTTPEAGTSVKTTLPLEAKELDQVRGGMALSAVFKRGVQAICLVTGGPKLAAKMAELDGKPADVAVLDDALLVAFLDGRVALYDGAAIAAAEGALSATAALTPPARGKPRVVVVAAPAKAAPSLWIGTTSGEILRAGLARDGEKVEEAPAPKSVAPREDLRAELASTKQALAEAEAAREAESAKLRALEEAQSAGKIDESVHRQAIEDLEAGHAAVLEAWKAEHAGVVDSLKSEHTAALDAQKAEHAGVVDALKTEHGAALEAQKAEHAGALDTAKAAYTRALEAQKAEHAGALDAARAEHAAALEAQKGELATAVDSLKTEHAAALEAQKAEHAGAIDSLKTEHTAALEAQKAEHATAVDSLKAGHAAALEAQKTEHATAVGTLEKEHAAAFDAERAAHASALEALEAEHTRALEALRAEHDAVLAARDAAHASAISNKEDSIAARSAERDALRTELDAARAEAASAAERARVAEEAAAKQGREIADIAGQIESLRAALAEERANANRDVLKWGDHTISLDRARGAIDSMLSRAQDVFKRGRG